MSYLSAIILAAQVLLCLDFSFVSNNAIAHMELSYGVQAKRLSVQPILSYGEPDEWDGNRLVAGNCVIKTPDAKYKMLFYGLDNDNVHKVGLAESTDGIAWTKYSGNPVLSPGESGSWDSGGVTVFPGSLMRKNDGTYYLYYSGIPAHKDIYKGGQIGLATSKDLIHWEKYNGNPILTPGKPGSWDDRAVIEASVVYDGNYFGGLKSYQMWYAGVSTGDVFFYAIGYAESIDGVHWIKYDKNPVFERTGRTKVDFDGYSVEVHHVLKYGNWYLLLYEAIERDFPSWFRIGLAYSKDGKIWARSPNNPILDGAPLDAWDMMVVHPSLLVDNGRILLYYVGLGSEISAHQIGVAELNPLVLNPVSQPFLSFPLWKNEIVSASGSTTAEIPSQGFRNKTFEVLSDQPGKLYIEIDSSGTGNWHTFERIATSRIIQPDGLEKNYARFLTSFGFAYVRIKFVPLNRALVSAWLTLEK